MGGIEMRCGGSSRTIFSHGIVVGIVMVDVVVIIVVVVDVVVIMRTKGHLQIHQLMGRIQGSGSGCTGSGACSTHQDGQVSRNVGNVPHVLGLGYLGRISDGSTVHGCPHSRRIGGTGP